MGHSFLDEEPPPGYVAGIGRGATGFSTQADLGSSSHISDGRTTRLAKDGRFEDSNEDDSEIKYTKSDDESEIEREDDEADAIFGGIEEKLKKRRKKRKITGPKETKTNQELETKEITPFEAMKTIGSKFEKDKQVLESVSEDQWMNLPESGDFTRKNKRRREELQAQQRFYRNSDTIITDLRDKNEDNVNVAQISVARDKVLAGKLAQVDQTNSNADSSLTKQKYLSQLSELKESDSSVSGSKFVSNIGNFAKTRALFKKLRRSEPHKSGNWIASARLEAEARNMNRARRLIEEGCEKCPYSEEVWLVSLEIHSSDNHMCRVIVADALKYNPESLKLWLKASELEADDLSKKRVLMKALEYLSKSESLWLEIIKYESDRKMQILMLQKASQLIPTSVDIWLRLAELQSKEEASATLKQANESVKPENRYLIWISAAKYEEETTSNELHVSKTIEDGFKQCGSGLSRQDWIKQAEKCEDDGYPLTASAITLNSMNLGLDDLSDDEKLSTWKKEVSTDQHLAIVRSKYMFITSNYPKDTDSWKRYVTFEKSNKQYSNLYVVYEMAIKSCPDHSFFYIMYAQDLWKLDNNYKHAEQILSEALKTVEQHEDIWLMLAKIQWKTGGSTQALDTYSLCRKKLRKPSSQVWIDEVDLLICLGKRDDALNLVKEGIRSHPNDPGLYLRVGMIYIGQKQYSKAEKALETGTVRCPHNPQVWIELAEVFNKHLGKKIKARSTLEKALTINPKSQDLYMSRLLLEGRNSPAAEMILTKGLREIPESPQLWSERIRSSKRSQRKNFYKMALKATNDSIMVIVTVACDLWSQGKTSKAKQFFLAGLDQDDKYGDLYIYYHAFLERYGEVEEVADLEKKFIDSDPDGGEAWTKILKDPTNYMAKPLELLRKAAKEALNKQS